MMAFNFDNLAPPRPAKSAFSFCRALGIFITIISSALQNANVDASNILVTNNAQCTRIGKRLMLENASVEQIYVAVSLCEGIVHPMDSGLGGGFQAVLYDYIAGKKISKYLMSREYSPYSRKFTKRPLLFGNSVGIPGVLAGYARLLGVNDCLVKSPNVSGSPHNSQLKYYSHDCIERIKNGVKSGFFDGFYSGIYQNKNNASEQSRVPPTGVPYQHIFRDCIRLARDGFRVSPTFAAMYSYLSSVDRLISYNPATGMAINLALANFIEFLSNDPLRLLDPYVAWANRNVAKQNNIRQVMLEDLHYFHSHLTTRDFLSYRADIRPTLAVSFRYRNVTYKLLTMPSPAGGEPIAFFAKMIEAINLISGRRGAASSLNSEQKSILFLLCSRFAYGIKPYFRQLNLATKRKLLVSEAPRLARKFYKQVSRANSSELVRLANQPKYRMFSTFGSVHLPQIRVAKQRHNSDLRAFEDVEENAIETGNFSAIFDQDDHNEHETADDSQFDFSQGDDINDEQDDDDEMDDMINEPFSTPTLSTSPRTTLHPPLYNHQYEELLTDFTHTMSTINMSEYYHTMDSDTEKEHFITSEDFEGGVDDNPYGTTNVIVKKGKRAIVATSSINHSYGSGIASSRLGIFYNNVLRDFTPNTWYQRIWLRNGTKKFRRFPNRIRTHFVPSSSMGCTLLINPATNNPVFGIGAAGGFKITGAIFNTLWNYFVHGLSLNNSIKRLRLITKMNYKSNTSELWYELPPHINASLIASKNNRPFKELNLNFSNSDLPHSIEFFYRYRTELNVMFIKEAGYSAVTAFTTLRGVAMGSYDHRRGGEAYIYK